MSLNLKNGRCIARILGGELNGELIHIDTDKKTHKKYDSDSDSDDENYYFGKSITLKKGNFYPVPNFETREITYICGMSGCGKSTMANLLAKTYYHMFPNNPIYLFSKLMNDNAFQELEKKRIIKRVQINESIVENPINIQTEIKNGGLVIFDDVDTFTDPKIIKAIVNLKNDILELGRHYNIYCIIISHLINPNSKAQGRTIMNELHNLIIFPRGGGSVYQQKYCLKNYFGFDTKKIDSILSMKTRWVQISKTYPQYILSEDQCIIQD